MDDWMDDPQKTEKNNKMTTCLFVFFLFLGQEASSEEVPEVYLEFWHR